MNTLTWSTQAVAIVAFALAAGACDVNIHEHRSHYDEPRATVVVREPEYRPDRVVVVERAPASYTRVVRTAPPPAYVEKRGAAPGRDYVWVDGYWVVQDNRWVWVRGHWDRPPHRGAHWRPHHWERHGDSFELRIGGWN